MSLKRPSCLHIGGTVKLDRPFLTLSRPLFREDCILLTGARVESYGQVKGVLEVCKMTKRAIFEQYLYPFFFSNNDTELVNNMSIAMCTLAIGVFITSPFHGMPYGRYSTGSMGIRMNARLGWFMQECPSLLVPAGLILFGNGVMIQVGLANRILIGLFMLHYFHRTFIYSFLMRSSKRQPIIVTLAATIFCSFNGFLQGFSLTTLALYPASWTSDLRFTTGVALFFIGMLINLHSDSILRGLRKPGETEYKIPIGGLFEFVSGANYFGEIVEWWGFALASWSFPATSFAIFTTLLLGWRACHYHVFYLENFDNYPRSRRAIIPFLI